MILLQLGASVLWRSEIPPLLLKLQLTKHGMKRWKKQECHAESVHNERGIFLWDTPLGEVAQPTYTHCEVTLVSALSGLAQIWAAIFGFVVRVSSTQRYRQFLKVMWQHRRQLHVQSTRDVNDFWLEKSLCYPTTAHLYAHHDTLNLFHNYASACWLFCTIQFL